MKMTMRMLRYVNIQFVVFYFCNVSLVLSHSQSDWEESSDEEEDKPKATSAQTAAPPKKRGTLKAKLAEKEKLKAERVAAGDDSVYDSDDVLDPREKARLDKEKELSADLNNAADLLGAAALGGASLTCAHNSNFYSLEYLFVGTSDKELDKIISSNPRTKEEFEALSSRIVEYIIKRHQSKPLYAMFVEHLAKELVAPLKDVETRKVASSLTTLANEKQREAKDKASGKKKKAAKPTLGSAKVASKCVFLILFPKKIIIGLTDFHLVTGLTPQYTTRRWTTLEPMQTISCRYLTFDLNGQRPLHITHLETNYYYIRKIMEYIVIRQHRRHCHPRHRQQHQRHHRQTSL